MPVLFFEPFLGIIKCLLGNYSLSCVDGCTNWHSMHCRYILLFIHCLQFDMLEMDRLERQLVNLPLLQDPTSYIPDTVDLTEDVLAREYWLYCFEEALDGVSPPGLSFILSL